MGKTKQNTVQGRLEHMERLHVNIYDCQGHKDLGNIQLPEGWRRMNSGRCFADAIHITNFILSDI